MGRRGRKGGRGRMGRRKGDTGLRWGGFTLRLKCPLFTPPPLSLPCPGPLPPSPFPPVRPRLHPFLLPSPSFLSPPALPPPSTEVVGVENLPPADAPAVYVANHQSFLDIYTLFQLRRPFKFISKTSNFLIPIVGWSMFLTGHVPLKRMDKRSQMECLKKCLELLQQGTPVLFFPEGTRTKDGKLSDFKKGAFSIAAKAGVPVVPITLIGTGALMPSGLESTLAATSTLPPLPPLAALPAPADSSSSSTASLATKYGSPGTKGGVVRVVVHPPITGKDADKLCEQSRAVIASTLRLHGLGVH
ncbi:unnamed protein product [Closterium sp. Naga37s-1]|nr:unnamed protein product [Closterium sp. Naga37s-1]